MEVFVEESSFLNSDGQNMFAKCWKSTDEKEPRALLFIAHGFAEHCARYEELANVLVQQDILVFAHDHVGHGRSEGERAQISSFDIYVRDVFQHIDQMCAKFPGIPIFLFGHSMGGTIAILAAMQRPRFFIGTILSAPAVVANPETATRCNIFLGNIFAWMYPSLVIAPAIDGKTLSHDADKVAQYSTDPLGWHGGLKAGWGMALYRTMGNIIKNFSNITFPFIVLHGDADELTLIEGSRMLHEKASSEDKTFVVYTGYFHEILNEDKERAEVVLRDIVKWVTDKLPRTEKSINLHVT